MNKQIILNRNILKKILTGNKNNLIVVIGPCSIHSYKSFYKYLKLLKKNKKFFRNLFIVMRVYLEKPRTIVGWKGYIYDPDLNYSYKYKLGIKKSIKMLKIAAKCKIPVATEFINPLITEIIKKYISIGSIGARTTESQLHRELSSGLNFPIGYKNNTEGNVMPAINSIISSMEGTICSNMSKRKFFKTDGNKYCFLIHRGGLKPNYQEKYIINSIKILKKNKIKTGIMIDVSHGNSRKIFKNQLNVSYYLKSKIPIINKIIGVMIESHISEGSQSIDKNKIKYNLSITDSCISWKTSIKILFFLNKIINKRKIIL
ncbi:3-deoxy-7-phosphoheptulonate synthase [Candidatus Vidania fulgoroideorum]